MRNDRASPLFIKGLLCTTGVKKSLATFSLFNNNNNNNTKALIS